MGELVEFSPEIIMSGEKTRQELVNQGAELISRQSRNARDLGEWFNDLKLGPGGAALSTDSTTVSAQQIVNESNAKRDEGSDPITYKVASAYGITVEAFPTIKSQKGMSFTSCRAMVPVRNAMGDLEAFDRWHYKVSTGICPETDPNPDYNYASTHPKQLVGKDLKRQIDIATGKLLAVKSDKVEEVTSTALALDNLSEILATHCKTKKAQNSVRSAIQKEVKRIEKDVRGHFIDEVNAAADTIAEQRTAELREKAEVQRTASKKAREDYERKSKVVEAMQKRLPMFMTKDEFKLVRGCLKSDRQPEDLRARFDKAYAIFNRLAEGGDW